MAAPPEVTMQELTGSWTMSKTLSDSFEPVLTIQGIPWIMRKVASMATMSMKVTQEVDDTGLKTLIFTQGTSLAIGGISEEKELRALDWREEFHTSPIFGTTSHRSRFVNLSTATGHDEKALNSFLIDGFLNEGEANGENYLLDLVIHQTNNWVMEQTWGFGLVNEERRLIRKMTVTKGDVVVNARSVYDWENKTDSSWL
ncbi:hypothetical protein V8C35DRAFT_315960 [Trichoderma chlorosporum]